MRISSRLDIRTPSSPRNENFNIHKCTSPNNIPEFIFIYFKIKTEKCYWSEQCFIGHEPEDCPSQQKHLDLPKLTCTKNQPIKKC